jgi:signal transduction histidine kinase
LIGAVNDLLERLQQVMQAQKRFVADAAHQLRTPFAGLKTQVELALRESDAERKQHALKHMLTSTRRGTRLVNQLLALARNEPGGQDTQTFTILELGQLAQRCAMQWVPMALEKNIDLGFETFFFIFLSGDKLVRTHIDLNSIDFTGNAEARDFLKMIHRIVLISVELLEKGGA